MEHHFNVELATEYGWLEAVLLNNLYFWIRQNEANNINYHDGCYWTYNSTRAFSHLFPYVSQRSIQNALARLKENGLIKTANYNSFGFDRTLWYAFTEKGESVMREKEMCDVKKVNAEHKKGKPIPDNKPDNKPDNNQFTGVTARRFTPPSVEEVITYCNERKNGINAELFVDFYASKGWKVGNQTMKDWKAAVRTWEKKDMRGFTGKQQAAVNHENSSFDANEFYQAALNRSYEKTGG